jgi:hypothetical protein
MATHVISDGQTDLAKAPNLRKVLDVISNNPLSRDFAYLGIVF